MSEAAAPKVEFFATMDALRTIFLLSIRNVTRLTPSLRGYPQVIDR